MLNTGNYLIAAIVAVLVVVAVGLVVLKRRKHEKNS
jgi:LPXTG-motif cell wall-anchored protein